MGILTAIFTSKAGLSIIASLVSMGAALFWYFWNKKRRLKDEEAARLKHHADQKKEATKELRNEASRISEGIKKSHGALDKHEFTDSDWDKQ